MSQDYAAEVKRLDALSKVRPLSEVESIMLERFLWRLEKKGTRRAPYGSARVLARAGIKRRDLDKVGEA